MNKKYDYGCVMLYFQFPELKSIHAKIDDFDIVDPGLETEPHCTLLYGLHDTVTVEDIEAIINDKRFSVCKLYNPSLFVNPEYDVLKYDVYGDSLHATNALLSKLPHTTSFPDYHPHLTIAYLASGSGAKYAELLNNTMFELIPLYAVYSYPNGTKTKIQIKHNL